MRRVRRRARTAQAAGKDDYVVSPCYGVVSVLSRAHDLRYRTVPRRGQPPHPLTPSRWAQYEPEMQAAWQAYLGAQAQRPRCTTVCTTARTTAA